MFGGEWHTGFVNAVQWIPGSNEEGSTGGEFTFLHSTLLVRAGWGGKEIQREGT